MKTIGKIALLTVTLFAFGAVQAQDDVGQKNSTCRIIADKAIMYYGYDPFYDEEPDYLPMTLEQQIRVVYDSDDIMTEHLIDFYNSSRQESYDIIPASTFAVSPKTDKVFTLEDTYPERFFKWADDFIHYIR